MKSLVRILALSAALGITLFVGSSSAYPSSIGLCSTFCSGDNPMSMYWEATYRECCLGTVNPCPAGTFPGGLTMFRPSLWGGSFELCPEF